MSTNKNTELHTRKPLRKCEKESHSTIPKGYKEIKFCNDIILRDNTWEYTNMNPTAPYLHTTVKLCKTSKPIRPIVNLEKWPVIRNSKIFI
jgi:hypothetical protein